MRAPLVLVAILATAVAMAATTAIDVLSHLDAAAFDVDALVHGDLLAMLASSTFWHAFPSCTHATAYLLTFGPATAVALVAAGLFAAARRWPRVPAAWLAAIALASGTIPFAIGALALRGNTDPNAAGPWLLWMLVGPCHAAILAWVFVARAAWLRARPSRAASRDGEPGVAIG